ncbi:pseudaminic acid biosynthesis-associated methylase [Syntrophomonas wolfei]|jgi:pseudaminic acid biosynthesis-associated methylase|uniref:pseudaminic acid biosynthesis-associated methylase n=2 Tax=Syntrophomonas wolfei TaxID=863 RepID=UPI00077400FD|nr:pseudaminic acid biosynthesis-associated methylase [Syntrophomonas wolfei]
MSGYKTEQEEFWTGQFGDDYTNRNQGSQLIASNTALFASIIARTRQVKSILELGANRGLDLLALRSLLPAVELSAIEINPKAVKELESINNLKIYQQSILDFSVDYQRDLVLSKGLLIHIAPEMLPRAYQVLYESSSRYICLAEYYNTTPVEVEYRGNKGKLFKRDFAGEMMDRYPDLALLDYGFTYHRDNNFPQGDLTWFVLSK